MSVILDVNGQEFAYPETNDVAWGPDATNWAVAVTSGMLQKSGGLFLLLDDVDFGPNFGLTSIYYSSRTADASTAGALRLANSDAVGWRNNANSADLLLGVNASDELLFNGTPIGVFQSVVDTSTIDLTIAGGVLSANIVSASITNALISASAAIAYTKLNLTNSIVNADVNTAAGIARTKFATGTAYRVLVNDASGVMGENIALTAARALVSDGNGLLDASAVTATELFYLSGTTSNIQTQLNGKQVGPLSGDGTTPSATSGVLTLSTVNANVGTYTYATVTADGKGRITAVANGTPPMANPMTTQGDVIVGGASGTPTRLAVGSASKVLRSDGTNPVYDFPEPTIGAKTANYNVAANDNLLTGSSSGGGFTFTLPAAAAGNSGKRYIFMKSSSDTNLISVTDGTYTGKLYTEGELLEVYSTGSAWRTLRRDFSNVIHGYAPGLVGFGTATSINGYWYRDSLNSIRFILNFNAGTSTGTEARVGLPFGAISSQFSPKRVLLGTAACEGSGVGALMLLGSTGFAYFTFGASSSNSYTNALGNAISASGQVISINVSVPLDILE